MKSETIVVIALIAAMLVLMLAAGGVGIWMMNTQSTNAPPVTTVAVPAPPRSTDAAVEVESQPALQALPADPAEALFVTAQQRLAAGDWDAVDRAVDKTADLGDDEQVRRLYNLLARYHRWDQVDAALQRAIDLDGEDHWHWYMLGVTALQRGDDARYAEACKGMIERFGDRPDPDEEPHVAERIGKMSLLRPEALDEATRQRAMELADHAVAVGRATQHQFLRWFELGAALADYRRGDFEAGLAHANEAVQGNVFYLQAGAHCIRAMALHKLERSAEATAALAEADALLEQVVTPDSGEPIQGGWNDWVMTWQLRAEARRLIEDAAAEPAP